MNKSNFHIDPYFYINTCTRKEGKQIHLRSASLIVTKESETGKQIEKKKERVVLSSYIMAVIKSNTARNVYLTSLFSLILVIMCSTSLSCQGIYIYIQGEREITTYTSNYYILLLVFLIIVYFCFVLSQTTLTLIKFFQKNVSMPKFNKCCIKTYSLKNQ